MLACDAVLAGDHALRTSKLVGGGGFPIHHTSVSSSQSIYRRNHVDRSIILRDVLNVTLGIRADSRHSREKKTRAARARGATTRKKGLQCPLTSSNMLCEM
jgi:hypothetical protein